MNDAFVQLLSPIAERLKECPLTDPAGAKAWLDERLPVDGPDVTALRAAAVEGADAGWLLPKENGPIRFGRVTKDLHGFSVDAVWMRRGRGRGPGGPAGNKSNFNFGLSSRQPPSMLPWCSNR